MGVVIDKIVDICVRVGSLVSPVVCNSNPEGFVIDEIDDVISVSHTCTCIHACTVYMLCRTQHVEVLLNHYWCAVGVV